MQARRAVALCAAALCALAPAVAAPRAACAATLAEVARETISANPEVRRDRALMRAAEHRIDEQLAGYYPRLNLEGSSGFEYTNSPSTRTRSDREVDDYSYENLWRTDGSVVLRQMVFDGFETSSRETVARAERLAAERRVGVTSERIALRVVEVYLDVMNTRELLRLARVNEGHHAEIRERVRERTEQGLTDKIELTLAEARLALAQALLVRRTGEERAANARYSELVGQAPGDDLVRPEAPSARTPADVDSAIENALRDNPQVLRTTALLDARRGDIAVARSRFYPRLDLEIAGTTGKNIDGVQGRDSDINVLLRLRYDLFNGMLDVATTSRRAFEASAAAQADGESRRQVREDTRVAYRNLFAAVARVEPLRDQVAAATRTVTGYLEQFDLGKRSLLDVLDARSELFGGQSELTAAEFAVLRAYFNLYYSMGRLREVLGLPD